MSEARPEKRAIFSGLSDVLSPPFPIYPPRPYMITCRISTSFGLWIRRTRAIAILQRSGFLNALIGPSTGARKCASYTLEIVFNHKTFSRSAGLLLFKALFFSLLIG
ncbi:unnamed protein product [Protopolystoma xenopodis]|uniref:Uncharacterized protein n=1 Tax=Protopolystoma xenopodis TaxID=117903 RepID=A0A448WLJ2_9PLAT|nr:unnamed protein product [Protopolystoma xenopodis]